MGIGKRFSFTFEATSMTKINRSKKIKYSQKTFFQFENTSLKKRNTHKINMHVQKGI